MFNPSSVCLSIQGVSIHEHTLDALIDANPRLEELTIDSCTFHDERNLLQLRRAKRLKNLTVSHSNITNIALQAIATLPSLKTLDISNNQELTTVWPLLRLRFLSSLDITACSKLTKEKIDQFIDNGHSITINRGVSVKEEQEEQRLQHRAVEQTGKLLSLNHKMSIDELYKTAYFIEKNRETWSQDCVFGYEARLPREVEYLSRKKFILIHLNGQNGAFSNHGLDKRVTTSILYNINPPQLIAKAVLQPFYPLITEMSISHCKAALSPFFKAITEAAISRCENEMQYLAELMPLKLEGVVETFEIVKTKKPQYTFFQKFYSGGTLETSNPSYAQIEKIALTLLKGLAHLHRLGIAHTDMHSDQLLVELLPNNEAKAAICDFGIAQKPGDGVSLHENVYHSDTRAIGCALLYTLGRIPEDALYSNRRKKLAQLLQAMEKVSPHERISSVKAYEQIKAIVET